MRTPAAQFAFLHPLVAVVAVLSLALTVLALIANHLCWRRRMRVGMVASLFGWVTVVLCLALGFEVMTITRIAATRPGISREEVAGLKSTATQEFLVIGGMGLLLGMPGALVGAFLNRRRRLSATPGEPK